MARFTFADIKTQLLAGDTRISTVGAFWGQAHLAGKPSPEHAIIAVPVTLHLTGRVNSVAYAEMPVVTGGKVRDTRTPAPMAWIARKLRERRRAGLLRFSMPDIGLSWRQPDKDADAVVLAAHFTKVLAEEYPHPGEELVRQFRMGLGELVLYLARVDYVKAGTTQPDKTRKS